MSFEPSVVCRGRLEELFTGFHDSMDGTFRFDNGRVWRQNEPYYFYYGLIPRPEAFVVEYFGRFFLFVDAVSDPEVGNDWPAARPCEVVELGQPEEGAGEP